MEASANRAWNVAGDRMFVTDCGRSLYSARLDVSGERNFLFAKAMSNRRRLAEI